MLQVGLEARGKQLLHPQRPRPSSLLRPSHRPPIRARQPRSRLPRSRLRRSRLPRSRRGATSREIRVASGRRKRPFRGIQSPPLFSADKGLKACTGPPDGASAASRPAHPIRRAAVLGGRFFLISKARKPRRRTDGVLGRQREPGAIPAAATIISLQRPAAISGFPAFSSRIFSRFAFTVSSIRSFVSHIIAAKLPKSDLVQHLIVTLA
jgi:hypothetical protein